MPGQLLPPPELTPPVPAGLTAEQRIRLWADLLDACEQFLWAGLCRKAGPGGDVQAAMREWNARYSEEHDSMMRRLMEEFERRSGRHVR